MTFNPIRGCEHLITLLTLHFIRCYSHSIPPELLDRDLDQLVSQFKFLFTFKRSRMQSNVPFPYCWFLNRRTINFYNNNLNSTQELRRSSTWIAMGATHGQNATHIWITLKGFNQDCVFLSVCVPIKNPFQKRWHSTPFGVVNIWSPCSHRISYGAIHIQFLRICWIVI